MTRRIPEDRIWCPTGDVLFRHCGKGVISMGKGKAPKPSKGALSKAGKVLASKGSSKPAKSNAGSTLGKG